jgi:hypothetical protein
MVMKYDYGKYSYQMHTDADEFEKQFLHLFYDELLFENQMQ